MNAISQIQSPDTLAGLDDDQRAAVLAFGEQTLVVAGAGSGKTRVLTYGLAHMLLDLGLSEREIMLLTFTRASAEAMRERAAEVTGLALDELLAGTFHAVGAQLLREADPSLQVIDETTAAAMLGAIRSRALAAAELEEHEMPMPAALFEINARCLEEGIPLGKVLATISQRALDAKHLIDETLDRYADAKAEQNLLDFTDVMLRTRELLKGSDGDAIRARTRAVLVDEAQDLNGVQRDILTALREGGAWVIQVGDPQQTLYGFRGASHDALLDLARDPRTTLVKLPRNYRSTGEIVTAAQALAEDSDVSLDIVAVRGDAGRRPVVLTADDPETELQEIADWASALLADGVAPERLAVLGRTREHVMAAARALRQSGIPFVVVGRGGNERQQALQGLTALLRLADQPGDEAGWQMLLSLLQLDSSAAMELAEIRSVKALAERFDDPGLMKIAGMLDEHAASLTLFEELLLGPYGAMLAGLTDDPAQHAELIADLLALGRRVQRTLDDDPGLGFMQALAFTDVSDAATGDGVRLATVHASKGLEWEHVLVLRVTPGCFPSKLALRDGDLSGERRALYVALTRAQDTLTVMRTPHLLRGGEGVDFFGDERLLSAFDER